MNEQRLAMDFLCGACNEYTRATSPAAQGRNTMLLTCPHCGEQWHITYDVLSLDPFTIGHWEIKRRPGTMRDGKFHAKEGL